MILDIIFSYEYYSLQLQCVPRSINTAKKTAIAINEKITVGAI